MAIGALLNYNSQHLSLLFFMAIVSGVFLPSARVPYKDQLGRTRTLAPGPKCTLSHSHSHSPANYQFPCWKRPLLLFIASLTIIIAYYRHSGKFLFSSRPANPAKLFKAQRGRVKDSVRASKAFHLFSDVAIYQNK